MRKIKIVLLSFVLFSASLFAFGAANELSLIDEAASSGMTLYWDSLSSSGLLEKNGHQLSFRAGDNLMMLDSTALTLVDAPTVENGVVQVSRKFMDSALQYFKEGEDENGFKIGAILIDPGHGGKDPGASGTFKVGGKQVKVQEKDVVLSIGKILYSKLKENYPEKQIIMTRSTDKFLTLAERTDIANNVKLKENEAVIYVSIHANASLDKKSSGYEVWYLSPGYRRKVLNKDVSEDHDINTIVNAIMEEEYTTESVLISKFITEGIKAQVGKLSSSRGIKAEEWFVVRNANMPSVLVETGFLTNPTEAALLADEEYLQKIAFGIYNGLQAFVTHFERSRGFTVKNEK